MSPRWKLAFLSVGSTLVHVVYLSFQFYLAKTFLCRISTLLFDYRFMNGLKFWIFDKFIISPSCAYIQKFLRYTSRWPLTECSLINVFLHWLTIAGISLLQRWYALECWRQQNHVQWALSSYQRSRLGAFTSSWALSECSSFLVFARNLTRRQILSMLGHGSQCFEWWSWCSWCNVRIVCSCAERLVPTSHEIDSRYFK